MQNLTLAHLTLSAPPADTIAAAAQAGFAAVGVRICARRTGDAFPVQIIGNQEATLALRRQAADAGIRLSNVSAYQFYPDTTWQHVAPVVETTAELGAPVIVANGFDPDESRFTALFARYCEASADMGIRVALEFLPYSAIRTLDQAMRVIEGSGAANAGVLLDALHLDRSGATPADIGRIPAHRIAFAQLCDAMKLGFPASDEALMQEARTARLIAGTGELPLYAFLDALGDDVEIEYEVARADLAQCTPLEKARAAREDADRFMAPYLAHRRMRRASV